MALTDITESDLDLTPEEAAAPDAPQEVWDEVDAEIADYVARLEAAIREAIKEG